MTKRAVVFDFGGVLFKTADYLPRHTWDDKLGLEHGSVEKVVHGVASWNAAQSGSITVSEYWQDVANTLGISLEEASNQLARDFYSGDKLDEDNLRFVQALRRQGIMVGLLSNDVADLLRPRLERLGITHLFDPLLISSELGVMKPHANAYTKLVDHVQRPPNEIIFIDDRLENAEAATAAGIHGVYYQNDMNLEAIVNALIEV